MYTLEFQHRFTNLLPGDAQLTNNRRQVFEAVYSYVHPTPPSQGKLRIYSPDVAALLDLSDETFLTDETVSVLSGGLVPQGAKPYAMCYGGHQFGHWAGQLGDGRAINLGEIKNSKGEYWSLQLKGAGPTPYSRTADGLAVLRSSIREFLCSEAMFYLGVPTTRALSLCTTGDQVYRDMFYDGHADYEQGAVVCRVAPSFLRFGNFEIFAARDDIHSLRTLVDYTITHHFGHLLNKQGLVDRHVIYQWFKEVCNLTQTMIVHWMRVGFVHGVMNTDNMSILGLTIDYGPYGWLEDYNPDWTPNTTDEQYHRYAFGNQAKISHWNLAQLAQVLVPLVDDVTPLQDTIHNYSDNYLHAWQNMMASKLGFNAFNGASDVTLMQALFHNLQLVETDMTIFFRQLAYVDTTRTPTENFDALEDAFYDKSMLTASQLNAWLNWMQAYAARLDEDGTDLNQRRKSMNSINPKYVLRNYIAQQAIDKAETNDFSMVFELLQLLKHPYDEQTDFEHYAAKRPEWARHRASCSMLSCSS